MKKLIWLLLTLLLALFGSALADQGIATPVAQDAETTPEMDDLRHTSYIGTQIVRLPVTLCFEQQNGTVTSVVIEPALGEVTYFFFVTQQMSAEGRFVGGGHDPLHYPQFTAYDLPLLSPVFVSLEPLYGGSFGGVHSPDGNWQSQTTLERGSITLTYNHILHFDLHGELISAETTTATFPCNFEYRSHISDPQYTGEIALPTYDEWKASQPQ